MADHSDPYDRPARVRVVHDLGAKRSLSVVFLYGDHDHSTREVLAQALAAIDNHVVVDLSWCAFLDTSIVGVILAKRRTLAHSGHALELVAPSHHLGLTRTIEQLGIRSIMNVHQPLPPFP